MPSRPPALHTNDYLVARNTLPEGGDYARNNPKFTLQEAEEHMKQYLKGVTYMAAHIERMGFEVRVYQGSDRHNSDCLRAMWLEGFNLDRKTSL